MIMYLSGFMLKDGKFTLEETTRYFTELCIWVKANKYSNENIGKSLNTVKDTYNEPDLDRVKGIAGLRELFITRYETYSGPDDYQIKVHAAKTYEDIKRTVLSV